jgi:hypothetical protein
MTHEKKRSLTDGRALRTAGLVVKTGMRALKKVVRPDGTTVPRDEAERSPSSRRSSSSASSTI